VAETINPELIVGLIHDAIVIAMGGQATACLAQ
jgi:hypothetical protein